MSVIAIPRVVVPPFWAYSAAAPAATFIGSGTTKYIAVLFPCPKAGTLDQMLAFFSATGTVVGRWSFQDPDLATGFPDLVEDQFRDITLTAVNGMFTPGLMTSDGTDSGVKRVVTAGQPLCAVWKQTSTLDASNFNTLFGIAPDTTPSAQYGVAGPLHGMTADATPTWTKAVSGAGFRIALKYSDGSYAQIAPTWYPVTVLNTHTFNSGSTPDERGARFIPPVNWRTVGGWIRADHDGNCTVLLYNDADSVIGTATFDADLRNSTAGGAVHFFWEEGPLTLVAGRTYRVVQKPTSVTNVSGYSFTIGDSAHLACFETGTTFYYTERTDAGAWTDTNTQVPLIGLYFDGIDVPVGAAGTVIGQGVRRSSFY